MANKDLLNKYKATEGKTVTWTFGGKGGKSVSVKGKNTGDFKMDLLRAEEKAVKKGFDMKPGRKVNIQSSASMPSNKQIAAANRKIGGSTRIGSMSGGGGGMFGVKNR